MDSKNELNTTNWFSKFSLSFLAIVGVINTTLFIVMPLLPYKLSTFILPAGFLALGLAILFSIGFSIYWHKRKQVNTIIYVSWLSVLLRY